MKTENFFNRFWEVIDALEKEKVDYILIGGFAMVLYGMPRATQDIDIFVRNQEENISKLQKALFSLFDDENVFEITQSELNVNDVIRYGTEEGFYIDVLSRLGDSFSFENLKFEETFVDGHKIKIATVDTLYKMKRNTFRAIDRSDLLFLEQLLKKDE